MAEQPSAAVVFASVRRRRFKAAGPGALAGPSVAVTPRSACVCMCVCARRYNGARRALVSRNVGQRDSSPLPDYHDRGYVVLFFFRLFHSSFSFSSSSYSSPVLASSADVFSGLFFFLPLHVLALLLAFSIILLYLLFTRTRTHYCILRHITPLYTYTRHYGGGGGARVGRSTRACRRTRVLRSRRVRRKHRFSTESLGFRP